MIEIIIVCSVVLLLSVISSKLLYRLGVPTLLIFLALGMLFGSDGIVGIAFDNYEIARQISSLGLVFIMFYGGFGTNWNTAKPVALKAVLMSTVGVIITAVLTGAFCMAVLKTNWVEGMLLGSVLASTDAASVFAVLRSRKLNLKGGLASLLEIESGSNDTFAYMLTVVLLTFVGNEAHMPISQLILYQLVFGVLIGAVLSFATVWVLKRVSLEIDGLYPIFVTGIVLLGYSLSEHVDGNGYLCVYIIGIIVGNSKIMHKKSLVHFFDGISWLMQIMLFFTLGLLSFPSHLLAITGAGILISVFMIVVARPVATFSTLSFFKTPIKQQLLVSWVGLRGAASIVFAIYAVTYSGSMMKNDIFHIVFFVALFSVAIQGSLIPLIAKKLDLVETKTSVFKTFTDYQDESLTKLVEIKVDKYSPWLGKQIIDAQIPEEILVVMVRRGNEIIMPRGSTLILEGDTLVLSGNDFTEIAKILSKKIRA